MAEVIEINKKAEEPLKDKNDATVYHRLLKEDEDKIYAFIRAKAEAVDKSEKNCAQVTALKEFEESLLKTSGNNPRTKEKGQKRLCFEHIPVLLNIAHASYLELLNEISKDPDGNRIKAGWATEQETRMCALCDMLTEDSRNHVLDTIRELASDEVRKLNLENRNLDKYEEIIQIKRTVTADELQPVDKVAVVSFLRSFGSHDVSAKTKEMGVSESYYLRFIQFRFNAIGLSLLAYVAKASDISLHWLLGLDESTTLLAKNGRTETIMAYFCLLPDDRKNIAMEAVSHI